MTEFLDINKSYIKFFPTLNPPSRACVQLPLDPSSPILIQIQLPKQFGKIKQAVKNVLHVQSISEWAPSCIGPYSQCVRYNNTIHMAGQIPLDPASMQILHEDLKQQFDRCILSCEKIGVAMQTDVRSFLLCANVYCSNEDYVHALRQYMHAYLYNQNKIDDDGDDDDDHSDDYLDEYLKCNKKIRSWNPIILIFVVPALPKNARVEIQMDLIDSKSYQMLDIDSDEEEEVQSSLPLQQNLDENNDICQNSIGFESLVQQIFQQQVIGQDVFSLFFNLQINNNGIVLFDLVENLRAQNLLHVEFIGQVGRFCRFFVGFHDVIAFTKQIYQLLCEFLKYIAEQKFCLNDLDLLGSTLFYNVKLQSKIFAIEEVTNLRGVPVDNVEFLNSERQMDYVIEFNYSC
eukprot:TRINITY_DN15616_c0_g1_i11.p2 TRINITY_DN15616_c0_g1~~TRINITY_DN15616_c0_g1_i11.p2  ORF type:complete len:433 (-),score=42.28 TRINITY_DN15616_c0_g1_i11:148-1353(-)